MKSNKVLFVITMLVAMLALSACSIGITVDNEPVVAIDGCEFVQGVPGMSSDKCGATPTAETTDDAGAVPEDEVTPVATETEVLEATATPEPTAGTSVDTYRGFRLDFPERSVGRVIVKETLVDGPAIHQDRDGNVTVVRKGASATFESGIIWLYKVGDANSVEDEVIFLNNQVKWFNDPSPLWIEPAVTTP